MKDPLKGFNIATTGDFGKQRSADNIKRWVEANGGRYVTKIDENTTQLICSTEHWKSQSPMVQAAKRYPKKVKIVTYDWLEDCLMEKARKREGDYLIKKHVKANRKRRNAAKGAERSALKKEGTSKKKPSFVDSSLALLKQHEEDFKSKKYASKPSVEDYSNYYKPPTEATEVIEQTETTARIEGEVAETGEDSGSEGGDEDETDTTSDPDTPTYSAVSQLSKDKSQPLASFKEKSQPPESFKPPEPIIKPMIPKTNSSLPEPANHHLYVDPKGHTYNITLVRIKVESNTNERYILRLYQSHSIPYTYALYQRYVKFKAVPEELVLVPVGSSWEQCFGELKGVFRELTGIEWDLRGVDVPAQMRDRTKFVFVRARGGEQKRVVGRAVVPGAVIG